MEIKVSENVSSALCEVLVISKFEGERTSQEIANKFAVEKDGFEGKLGEKVFKMFLLDNNIPFQEDTTSYDEEDNYDFMIGNDTTIDVKTRTKSYHTRTLEMVEQFEDNPKDLSTIIDMINGELNGLFL